MLLLVLKKLTLLYQLQKKIKHPKIINKLTVNGDSGLGII